MNELLSKILNRTSEVTHKKLLLFFQNVVPGQVYQNADGTSSIEVHGLTNTGRYKIVTVFDGERKESIKSVDDLRTLLTEKQCDLHPDLSVEPEAPASGESTEPVVDFDTARVVAGGEPAPEELDQKNTLAVEGEQIDRETETVRKAVSEKLSQLVKKIGKKQKYTAVRARGSQLLDENTTVYNLSLSIKGEQGGQGLTEGYVARRRDCLKNLQGIDTQVDALLLEVENINAGAVPANVKQTGNAAGAHDNLEALRQARAFARQTTEDSIAPPVKNTDVPPTTDAVEGQTEGAKKSPQKPVILQGDKKPSAEKPAEPGAQDAAGGPRGTGPEGPKGPEEFGTVLGELRTEVATIIKAIKTPQDFGALREPMVLKESKESGREPRRYFFHLKSIRERVGNRELEEGEMALVTNLEKELRQLADQKFDEVLVADFKEQHQHGRAVLNEAKDEATLTALADTWAKESPIVNSWEAVSQYLTEEERTLVREGRERQSAVLMRALEKKLARFHDGQEFKKFVGHPEGRVLAERFREALSGEWRKFQGALKYHKLRLSEDDALAEWNEHYLPVVKQAILTRLTKQPDVTQDQAEAILRTIMNDLDHQERAKKNTKKQ